MTDQTTTREPRVETVGKSGIYPMSGPWPPGNPPIRGQGALAHPEERALFRRLPIRRPATAALMAAGTVIGGYFLYQGITRLVRRRAPAARSSRVTAFIGTN